MEPRTTVYTDGACLGNPGPGGWAWAVIGGAYASGAASRTTNQRMELTAALEAARSLEGPLDVVSDSTYLVNCFRDRWWEGWLARSWLNKARQPVANRDLWEPLVEIYRADPSRISFRWVKGHSNDPGNDLVDRLAVEAARTQGGRSGTGRPTDLGEPDAPARGHPGGSHAPGREAIAGHGLLVTGHRPPELGGYGPNPTADATRAKLGEILTAKRQLHPDLVVLSGMGLGAEQLGTEAARAAGIPYVAVLAYPEPGRMWPQAAQEHLGRLVDAAREVMVLQDSSPADRAQAGAAMRRRDAWLARNAAEAVVVWDGEDPGVGRLVRSLSDSLGEEMVWILNPPEPSG